MRSTAPTPAARIGWPEASAAPAFSACILVDGDPPFDRRTLEESGLLPATPHAILYCSELPGNTPIERGQYLLAEIRRRKAAGEFSTQTPALLFLHARRHNGELMVGDWHDRLSLPLAVLLHTLSAELFAPGQAGAAGDPAPVVLSSCEAGAATSQLQDFPRPILVNGGEDGLFEGDARAVFRACVRMAERSWREASPLPAQAWFDRLAAVSGEMLQQVGMGDWIVHDLLESSASLASCSEQQAALHVRAKLLHGSVDDLAEALLLFGTGTLSNDGEMPAVHFLLEGEAHQLHAKVALLAAAGVPIDQRNAAGRSALYRACDLSDRHGGSGPGERMAIVRLLLANGARPDLAHAGGHTPQSLAAASGMPALQAAFDPQCIARDRNALGAGGLRIAATTHHWENVLSLLDDPQQAMEVDDTDGDEQESSRDTGSANIVASDRDREQMAVEGLLALGIPRHG